MSTAFEDLRVLQAAEGTADEIWKLVVSWDSFAKEVVGQQLARAADSIGANIAEAFGRFHYGEKIQFLYYSRGSLFETKYWLNRAMTRELMPAAEAQGYAMRLSDMARQINAFADSLKSQKRGASALREPKLDYAVDTPDDGSESLFSSEDLEWLQFIPMKNNL